MKNRVKVGESWIGPGERVFIIAEAGANHDRNLAQAKELIAIAAEAGADAVKFQTYRAEQLYSKKTPKFPYLGKQNVYELIKSIELPREWQRELADYAFKKGIIFMSTPFDREAVDQLAEIGVPAFKVASFELVDLSLIRYMAQKGKPMIISTGLANLGEIEEALAAVRETGNDELVLLHCNSLYPTPPEIVNLKAMETMKMAFKIPVGFSDHTLGLNISLAAAALGADLIEKHFTISRDLKGPDHSFALEPRELEGMVKGIREIEKALGNGIKKRSREEEEMARKGRRSLIVTQDIAKGTRLTAEMLSCKRPGFGIKPRDIDKVIGRMTRVDLERDDILLWKYL